MKNQISPLHVKRQDKYKQSEIHTENEKVFCNIETDD